MTKKLAGINSLYVALVVVIIVVALCAAYFVINNAAGPVVAVGDTVNVSYTGTFTNGTVFDSSVGKQPLQFTVGSGQLIKGFDQGVIGMRLNEQKTITIPANEAYGEVNPALIVPVPSNAFGNQTMRVGMVVSATTNGIVNQGMVTAVNNTTVMVDFNPPLAGKTLIFTIKVLAIKKG
jgi:FKBP-type peptidyl-prolyl cis-trans isomerase 2